MIENNLLSFLPLPLIASVILVACGAKNTDLVKKAKSDARDFIKQGNESYRLGRLEDAARYYDRARAEAIKVDDLIARSDADNNIGHLYFVAGDYKNAERMFNDAIFWSRSSSYMDGIAAALSGKGMVALNNGDAYGALRYFGDALAAMPSTPLVAAIYSNMGEAFRRLGKLDSGRRYLEKAIKSALKSKRHMIASVAHYRMAVLSRDAGDLNSALKHAHLALEEDKKVEYSDGIAKDLELLADIYEIIGDEFSARFFKRRSLDVKKARSQ